MISNLGNCLTEYTEKLPRNIPLAAFKSAIYSFAISVLLSGNINIGMHSASLAATAAVVNGLTMPVFRHAFANQNGNITWYQHVFSKIANLAFAQMLINALAVYRVDLIAGVTITVGIDLLFNGFKDRSTQRASEYIFI